MASSSVMLRECFVWFCFVLYLCIATVHANDDLEPGFHVMFDTPSTLDVQGNDASVETITGITQPAPAAGTVSIVGTEILFTPVGGYTGTAQFTYTTVNGMFTVDAWVGYRYMIPPRGGQEQLQSRDSFVVISPFAQTPLQVVSGLVHIAGGANFGGKTSAFNIPATIASPSFELDIDDNDDLTTHPHFAGTFNVALSGRGIIVDATAEASVLISQRRDFHQSSLTAKGHDGRGTEFFALQMYSDHVFTGHYGAGITEANFISAMAYAPNTVVTFNLPTHTHVEMAMSEVIQEQLYAAGSTTTWLGTGGGPVVCTLPNIGDSCTVMATDATLNNPNLNGARITSDKPISVASGTTDGAMDGCGDHGWDQLIPIENVGRNYILVASSGLTTMEFETAVAVATEDNTDLFVDGVMVAAGMARGQSYFFRPVAMGGAFAGEPTHIRGTRPLYIGQSSSNNGCETGMSIIPAYILTAAHEARFKTPPLTDNAGSGVSVVTTTNAISTLEVHHIATGSIITPTTPGVITRVVPNRPDLTTIRIPGNPPTDAEDPTTEILHDSEYYVRAAALTQVGVVFGTGPGGGFGYVTDFTADPLDSDLDTVADIIDLDVDNDGILDTDEYLFASVGVLLPAPYDDADDDDIPNFLDADSPNCGLFLNGICSNYDTDGDTVPNHLDLDSDNDGIPDLVEGGTDPAIYDLDNDWVIDLAIPVGANGLADALETSPDSGVHIINPPRDTDGDGVNDYHDLDSDVNSNDGMLDIFEARIWDLNLHDNPSNGILDDTTDSDLDGIADTYDTNDGLRGTPGTPAMPIDTDMDGVEDYRDLDSDNDGIFDITESGLAGPLAADTNDDGFVDIGADNDLDGIMDVIDSDNGFSSGMARGSTDNVMSVQDFDGDNVEDYRDLDSDQDGVSDLVESGRFTLAELFGFADTDNNAVLDGPDTDQDGIQDSADLSGSFGSPGHGPEANTNGMGNPDYINVDSDGDGTPDLAEVGGRNPAIVDPDGNGMLDLAPDADGDGIFDSIDDRPAEFGWLASPNQFEITEPDASTIWWMYLFGRVSYRTNFPSSFYTHVRFRLYSVADDEREVLLATLGNVPIDNSNFVVASLPFLPHHTFTGRHYVTASPNNEEPPAMDFEYARSEVFEILVWKGFQPLPAL